MFCNNVRHENSVRILETLCVIVAVNFGCVDIQTLSDKADVIACITK